MGQKTSWIRLISTLTFAGNAKLRIKQWHWSFQETIPSWDRGTPRKKYPIYDLTLNQYPVSGLLYNWAFVHGLINNDEKVASSKKTQFETGVQKPYPI